MFRAVLDTNIYISALCFPQNTPPSLAFILAIQKKYELWTSAAIILEISKTLEGKFGWEIGKIKKTVKLIGRTAQVAYPNEKLDVVEKDSDDNKVLECAVASNSHFIVTGDHHLLEMKTYKNINIVVPVEFINLFKE